MRLTTATYLTNLLALQHSSYLLEAFGIQPQSLAGMLRKSTPTATDDLPENPAPAGTVAYLDTKSSFGEQNPLSGLAVNLPVEWIKHTAEHERIKRRVAAALKSCTDDPPVEIRKRFHPEVTAKRLSLCQSSHMVLRSRQGTDLAILPLMCLSPFCPSCSRLKTARQLDRIRAQVKGLGVMQLRWITLTVRNCAPGALADTLDRLLKAWRELRAERNHGQWSNRVDGYLWSLEITLGRLSTRTGGRGWHPHIHIFYDGDFWPQADLEREWQARLAAQGLEGSAMIGACYWQDDHGGKHRLDGKAAWASSTGLDDHLRHVSECLEEVSKYTLAPMESNIPRAMVFELANALFGRHTKGSSGTLELRNLKSPPRWYMEGPLGACTDRQSKYYLASERDQKALIEFGKQNPRLWANLCRYYEFFYDAERNTHSGGEK